MALVDLGLEEQGLRRMDIYINREIVGLVLGWRPNEAFFIHSISCQSSSIIWAMF